MGAFIERLNDEQRTALAASKMACADNAHMASAIQTNLRYVVESATPRAAGHLSLEGVLAYIGWGGMHAHFLNQGLSMLGVEPSLLTGIGGYLAGSWMWNFVYLKRAQSSAKKTLHFAHRVMDEVVEMDLAARLNHKGLVRALKQTSLKPDQSAYR